jgi:transcriptional regulator with XRE-family HTH domain
MSNLDICVQFGQRIRALRLKRKWTQFEMSERIGLDRSYLAELETGKIEICLRNLALIAQGLDMEPWELLRSPKRDERE